MDNTLFKNRPTKAVINLSNLKNNLDVAKSLIGKRKIMGVVKANAYGHGLVEISKALEDDVDYLGVAYIEEALILRKNGIKSPILVLGAIHKEQIDDYILNNIEMTGSSLEKITAIFERAKSLKKKAKVHIKIDTGMGRIGVQWDRVERFLKELFKSNLLDDIEIVGIYTHFSSADTDKKFTKKQNERFQKVLDSFSKYIDTKNLLIHTANSSTVANYSGKFLNDMARVGLLLYGYSDNSRVQKKLKPVMSFKTVISYFKVLEKGCPIGYNQTHITRERARIVALPVGYADGYPIELSNRASVFLNDAVYPIVGKVCMDQCMINIGSGESYVGDEVELFGENISLWDLCEGSIKSPYTLLTGISERVPRIYT
ncbi:MAG: alanine racemase [Candidatus Dojkabacteria bacterium]